MLFGKALLFGPNSVRQVDVAALQFDGGIVRSPGRAWQVVHKKQCTKRQKRTILGNECWLHPLIAAGFEKGCSHLDGCITLDCVLTLSEEDYANFPFSPSHVLLVNDMQLALAAV